MRRIQGLETSFTPSVSFPAGRYSGADKVIPIQFRKQRWQPENNYWHQIGPWEPAQPA